MATNEGAGFRGEATLWSECEHHAAAFAITRYDGITHDFMMLNPLSGTHATRAAVAQAIAFLRKALHGA